MNDPGNDLVAQFKSSGKTQEAFCEANNIPIERLRYHLYKKGSRKASKSVTTKKGITSPAFISFNNSDTKCINSNKHSVTIINGRFTIKELSDLIARMEVQPC
jgi:hypothetical protein